MFEFRVYARCGLPHHSVGRASMTKLNATHGAGTNQLSQEFDLCRALTCSIHKIAVLK